jgi:hypothetical protein
MRPESEPLEPAPLSRNRDFLLAISATLTPSVRRVADLKQLLAERDQGGAAIAASTASRP